MTKTFMALKYLTQHRVSIDLTGVFIDTGAMSAMNLNFSDRTAVIAGSFGPMVQNLASALSENGADVALVTDQMDMANRFCQNLMDLREVSERYGRSVAIESNLVNESDAQDAFSRSAELFGTTDIYIDTHLFGLNLPLINDSSFEKAEKAFGESFQQAQVVAGAALSFIRNRSKSRLLFVTHELDLHALENLDSALPGDFRAFLNRLCQETLKEQITVNGLALGASEEYLLSRYKAEGSIQSSLKKLQEDYPKAKLVDYSDVSAMVSFMVSPLSTALNGQLINLDHGLKKK